MKEIELTDVCFAYEEGVALQGITFSLEQGQTLVLEGPNGCGKSTLLSVLNALSFPQRGRYLFEGKEISARTMKDQRFARWFHQRMGYVFQSSDIQLFCGSVQEEIAFGPLQMGLSEEEVRRRCDDVMELFDLTRLKSRAPYHLSGGEKKKTALACVLVMNPRVLVLDEPLAGLDEETQEWLLSFLLSLKESGRTMVIATHNRKFADRIADRSLRFHADHTAEIVERG